MKTRTRNPKDDGKPVVARHGYNTCNADRQLEVDLTLAILCAMFPGEEIPGRWICELTGLSHGGVHAIEQRAMRKLRTNPRLKQARQDLRREVAA